MHSVVVLFCKYACPFSLGRSNIILTVYYSCTIFVVNYHVPIQVLFLYLKYTFNCKFEVNSYVLYQWTIQKFTYLFLYKIAVFQFKQGKFIKQYVNKPMGKKNLNRLFNQKSKHNYKLSILRIGY